MRENERVRKAARSAGVPLWQVAAKLGVSKSTLTRWLRFPLESEKEAVMLAAIDELKDEVTR